MAKQYPVLPTYDDLMNAWKRKNTTQQPRPTMLDAAMEETMRYAQQGSQQRQNVAKTLTGGMTQRKQGDIKTWDWDLGRRTILDNEIANKYFREQGLFNTEDYAFNNAYVHLVGDDYLKSMLPVLGERIAASKLADEEAKTIRQQTAETSSRWIDLMKANNETEMDRWHNMLMADYLLGDKKQLFDFEAIDNRYAEMSDEEYEQEYKRLSDQWNNLDWETLTGSKANQYESQTGTLEGYRSTVEKELLRGAELEAMQADIRSHADYGSLSQYKGMQADADAWIDNTIDQNDIAAFNDLYSFMNINATWEQKSNAREKLANVARYLDEGYDYLTPDELADYNALYNAGRLEDAEKYLELLRPELLYRRAMVMKSYTEAKATNPYLAVPSWLDARIQNVANVFYLPQQIYETATGRDNPYSSAFDAANKVAYTTGAQMGAIQNWEAPEVLKDVVNYAYQGVTGATDNTMRLVSAGFNPTASLIIAGLQSASGSLKESAERDDMSAAAKIVKAIGTAAIEVGTEKIGLDALFDTGKNGAMQYIKNVVLSELGEETLNYISGDALEAVVAFLFEHEADIKSGAEFWEGLTDTAITTILSSLLMGGGGAIAQDVNTRATGKQLLREGDIEGVLKIAESMPAESASAKEAAPIRELQKGGKKVSTRQLGKLVNAVAKDIGDQNAATVNRIYEEAIEDRLVELGEDAGSAKKLAPVIRRVSKGEQIPLRERAAIAWTDNASQVVKELATETREGEEARVGQSWKTQTQGKLTEAAVGTLGKAAQFREALTSKTSNVTAASKAAERAKALTKGNKGKNKLQAKELAFDDGTKGQGEFKKVIKDGDTLKVGISIDGSDQLKEVSVDSLTGAGDEGLATILEYAAHESRHAMSTEEINIMAGTYAQQGGDAQEFIQQFEDSYLAGYSGVEKTPTGGLMQIAYEHGRYEAVKDEKNRVARAKKARSNAAPTVGWLGDVASDADVKGSGDAKALDEAAKGMTEGQQLVVEFAKNLSRNTGLNIVLFRSKAMDGGSFNTQNGSYDASTNTIYLDVHAGVNNAEELARQKEEGKLGYAIMRTMGHEVTHAIEATSVDFYDQYKQAVKEELTAGGKDWAQLVRRKLDNAMRTGQKLTYAGAEAEVVADASEYMLQDSQFVNNMDAGLKNKVKRIMQDFIGKIRAAFKALTGGHEESMALRTMQNGVMQYSERLQKLWDAGFMEMATAKVREDQIAEGGRPTQKQVRETEYDYSAPFAQQVDDWVDGKIPERDTLLLGRTPSVLREIGFSDLPMTIDQKHMRYMLGEPKNADHDLGIEIVKRLPELVSNPVAIIANPAPNKGTRAPGVMIIFAEKNENANGRRIVGAVSVLENGKINGITIDSTRLETAHSRGDVDKKIADAVQKERNGGYGVYYINKNALSLLEPSQSQVLGTLGHEGVIHSIREAPEFVNSKFMEQTDTVQFRKWFEGSKIVNEDGTAKVMYHGTPYGGFTVFKSWQYFTDNKEYADKYHNPSASSIRGRYNPATNPQTYEVYLSVKKPFDTRDPKIRKIWRDEFHGNYSGTPLSERGLPDWTDGIDLIDFIEENDYDYDAIILDEGGAGGYGDEVQDRGISVVVRNSTQVKSATGNVGTFDTQNPDIRYSRRDEEYMDAVNSGDTSKARQLVTEAAKEAGYKPLRLYHGTKSFGFTKFDVGKSDDKLSIFATDSLRIAESYSGENVNRNLKKASKEDRYEFLQRPSAELLPYVHEHIGEHLRLPTEREMRDYTDEASTTILKAFDAIQKYLDDHNDTLRIEAKQALTYMLTYAEKMAEFMTLDMEDEADGYMIRMKYEDAKLDLSFEDRDAYDALYDVAGRPVIEAANKLLQARFSDPFYNEKTKTFVSKWDVTDRLGDAIFSGIYDLYGIDGNLFEMDANDANWNTLDGSAIGREGVFVNTRAVAEYAKENGYDGVLIKNVRDGGGMTPYHGASNVFIYFNNTALKSADLVTYDDNGDVIPLSERFDKNQEDIRYSRRDEAPDGVSIREFLGSMKPTDRMTETEKLLLKRYQENLRTLEEKEKLVAEQEEIIRTAPIKSDELTMAKNRHQIYRTQANRAARALMDAERSEGFARVMATSQEVVNRYLLGSAGAVGDAADVLDEEIAGLTAQLKAVEADVTRTASGQRTAFARGLFDQKQLNEAAQKLKDTYGSRMSVKAIADRLALAYGEIYAENGAEGAKLFMAAARDLAEDMLRGNKYRYKSEILPLLAEQIGTISLTETDVQEIRNAGLTVSEYKRMLSPYIKVVQGGSGLSSYASNAAYYGEGALASVLGEDIEGNLAMHLYDVISREKDQEAEISYEGMSEGQLIAEAMADIAGANLPMSTDSKTVDYLRKELLKYAGESAQAAQKVEQAIMNAQAATRRASGVWRAAVQEVNTAKQAVEYYRKLEEQRRLTELKEQKQEITAQLRSDYAKKLEEKVQKQRTEYREREQKEREYRHSREELDKLRRRIGRNVKRLNTMRMRETDQRHVPQEFQHLANAVMQTFTDSSLSKLAFSAEKTASLARRYRLLQEVESDMTHYWDDEIEGEIENLVALSEAYTTIREREAGVPSYFSVEGVKLETEILTGVDNIVSNVLQMIDSANDAFLLNRNETFEAYATKTGEEIRKKQDYKQLKGWLGKAQKMLDENIRTGNMTPIYFMEHLQSPLLKEVFDEVRMGQSDYAKIVAQGKDFVQGAKEKYHYGAWVADGKLKMKTSQGHQIELTREEAAELYAIAKRESTNKLYQTEHLLYGGFQYKDITKKGEGLYAAKKESHQLDAADIAKISRWLTDEQKAYADTLVGFLSTTMADYGNAASMEMYGYKKFKEAYYIPFHTAAEQRFQRGDEGPQGENAGTGRLKNSGFTKKLQHGANATLVVGGLTDTVSEHIHKMATYAAMVQPIENMKRLLNHKVMEPDGTTNTIRALIGQKYGQASQDYMAQLLKDLNGAAMGDERATDLVNSWLNAFKRGAVMASASVVLQQPTAMARAMAYISPKYFAQNPIYRPSKGTWDEMMKYAGTAVIKDMGKFDVGMGLTARQYIADEHLNAMEAYSRLKADSKWEAGKEAYKRALDWLTAAPGKADQWTWGLIWKAVKAEQAELHPGMDVNSEEFQQLCGDRFDDVIDHTQVYDSVITRSNLMRSKNGFHRMATSFMSEPTLSINMLYDAFLGKHDKKQRAKILGGVIVSQVLAGAMAALAQAWNDDEDKRNWLERYADRATANILDNLNPLGMLPYVSDLMSLFAGYEVERPDMAAIADIIDYGKTFISKAADPDKALTWKDYENFVGTLANMAGLPAKNISREVRRTRNLIVNSQWTAPDAFSVGQAMLENVPFYQSKNAVYYERIVAAELNGDVQKAQDYREYMLLSKMVSEEAMQTGLKKAMQERFISGDADEDDAKQYLLKIGAYDTESDAHWELDKWKDMRDEGIAAGEYRKYADFFQAVETGENLRAVIKEYLDNGVSKTTLASQITSQYKQQLIDLKASGKGYADLQARLLTAYEVLGYDRAQKQKDIQKWFEKK